MQPSLAEIAAAVEEALALPHGRRICNVGAHHVARKFGGVVVGFSVITNPQQRILRPPEFGHTFALVAGLLLDPWAFANNRGSALYNLETESASIGEKYGPWHCWTFRSA